MRYEWRKSSDFAEYAEALKINTSQIMAASVADQSHIVILYTPDLEGRPPVWQAALGRDADGILVVKGEPTINPLFRTGDE